MSEEAIKGMNLLNLMRYLEERGAEFGQVPLKDLEVCGEEAGGREVCVMSRGGSVFFSFWGT